MPRLLYVWEYGADLGHVNVFLPIAKELRMRGWEIRFAIPDSAPARNLLLQNGFDHAIAPGSTATYSSRRIDNHPELILSLAAIGSGAACLFMLQSWLSMLELLQPDVIVGDYAVTALMAARLLQIPSAVVNLGFFYPVAGQLLPGFSAAMNGVGNAAMPANKGAEADNDVSRQHAASVVLQRMNDALAALHAPLLETFHDIYHTDTILRLNFSELCAFKPQEGARFLGAVISDSGTCMPCWPQADLNTQTGLQAKKVFAYLKAGNNYVTAMLDALANASDHSVIAYLPGWNALERQRFARAHMAIGCEPFDLSVILRDADLVICHAGAGMIAQSLLAGVPLLLAPTHTEQGLNAGCVVKLGAGLSVLDLPPQASKEALRQKMDQILDNPSFRQHADDFQQRNRAADIGEVADEIAELLRKQRSGDYLVHREWRISHRCSTLRMRDLDVVFLSCDEPNADAHWRQLRTLVPQAMRVEGVAGFDAAHKAAAQLARTERFILIDADNLPDPAFLQIDTEVPADLEYALWQWSSVNEVTGLSYPFGGIKVWRTDCVRYMRTHELCTAEDGPLLLDFWAQPAYRAFYPVFSRNYTNGSPYQAFRSAFRETFKLACSCGMTKNLTGIESWAHLPHYRRMAVWMSAGADVENGYWSLLGARMGFLAFADEQIPAEKINDYHWFKEYWHDIFGYVAGARECADSAYGTVCGNVSSAALVAAVVHNGDKVRSRLKKPAVLDLTPQQSTQFKAALAGKLQKRSLFSLFDNVVDF